MYLSILTLSICLSVSRPICLVICLDRRISFIAYSDSVPSP